MNGTRDDIVILGAGPTGLGAAHRLEELGHEGYFVHEANGHVGGLAATFMDDKGFWWDIGGHVLFSHYGYFDELMESLIPPEGWLHHERESWVRVGRRFVPYPFQNNIGRLPIKEMWRCLSGLADAWRAGAKDSDGRANFRDWIMVSFGEGVAELFMLPYNAKVWACPAHEMSCGWIGERVSTPDFKRVLENVIHKRYDASWGPNNRFKFPLQGGTGAIWQRLAERIPAGRLMLNSTAVRIDLEDRKVGFKDGSTRRYGTLISTIPLDVMAGICDGMDEGIKRGIGTLRRTSVHVVGIGVKGDVPKVHETKCWMYFPEPEYPFYRVTVFSRYSPRNAPEGSWSLMAEVTETEATPEDGSMLIRDVVRGLTKAGLLRRGERIISAWHYRSEYGNPIPTLYRDEAVDGALKYLESKGVYSRGRFGAWKYEVSNMDHSLMQGVEVVDRLLAGGEELTLPHPHRVNRQGAGR